MAVGTTGDRGDVGSEISTSSIGRSFSGIPWIRGSDDLDMLKRIVQ